ncbi:MAG TPA: PadR family transcriptional regulator [Firmicutes bacterium]|nr:PadR family transcriptional regulator [Bacillota bacterium]
MCEHSRGFGYPGAHLRSCGCHDPSAFRGGMLLPTLLLLLKKKPAHGYELMEELNGLNFLPAVPDPGVVYRHLRRLEVEGMVVSRLEQSSGGPARKVYSITPEGEDYLGAWVSTLRARKASLEGLLAAYERLSSDGKDGEGEDG